MYLVSYFSYSVTAPDGVVGDVNVVRSGDGCPTQAISAGTVETTGIYKVDGGVTAVNVEIDIELQSSTTHTSILWTPTGIATPSDISYPSVVIPADTPTTVNTGGSGYVVLYLGGESEIVAGADIITGENVAFNIVAIY